MKPTKLANLSYLTAAVAVAGFFVIRFMVGSGLPSPVAGLNMVILQPVLSVILVISSVPMLRYKRALKNFEAGKAKRPGLIDAGYAVRTVALAKAVSLTGSIFTGWFAGLLVEQLSNTEGANIAFTIFAIIGALFMTVAGIFVENLFRVPPDENGDAA